MGPRTAIQYSVNIATELRRLRTDGDFRNTKQWLLGIFSNDNSDGNLDVKKAIGLLRKTTTLHVHHAFLYISLPSSREIRLHLPFSANWNKREFI